MEKLFNVYARKKQKWSNTFTSQWGETKDISVFRFYFFQLVRYLDPSQSYPRDKMLPGYFLGIAESVGDEFTFYVLTDYDDKRKNKVITRSVVRPRQEDDCHPVRLVELDCEVPNDLLVSSEEELIGQSRSANPRPNKRRRKTSPTESSGSTTSESTQTCAPPKGAHRWPSIDSVVRIPRFTFILGPTHSSHCR